MGTSTQAQGGRSRAREGRLKAARERRLQLDPDVLARDNRIDEATVDFEVAWQARAVAEKAVARAEAAASAAVERLVGERLTAADVVKMTGLDRTTIRRLRQSQSPESPSMPVTTTAGMDR